MIYKTSTFPNGPARHMDANDIVQELQPNGRFKDSYVGALAFGDEYYAPRPVKRKRTAEEILAYIEDEQIEWLIQDGVDGEFAYAEIYKGTQLLILWKDNSNGWITDCMNYLIDESEGLVH